ncbi:MAG: hypothetical protein ACI81T_003431, partial [Bacteroidia bacterium]
KIVGIASLWILFLTKNRPKRNKYNGVSYLIPFTKDRNFNFVSMFL